MIYDGEGRRCVPEILSVSVDRKASKKACLDYFASTCGVLSVYLEGGPAYQVDGVKHEYAAPIGLLIPSGTQDQDLQEGKVRGMYVTFKYPEGMLIRGGQAGRAIIKLGDASVPTPMLKRLDRQHAENLVETMEKMRKLNLTSPIDDLRAIALLFQAMSDYVEAPDQRGVGVVHREAERLKVLVDEFAYESVSMAAIYRQLTLSASHAEALFSKAYGMSPKSYRTKLRLGRARELLISTRMNVGEVASEIGIGDPLYFSRVFKKRFGTPPSKVITNFKNTRK